MNCNFKEGFLTLFLLSTQIMVFAQQEIIRNSPDLSGRPSSEPYLSGDTFRKYCNIIFDEEYRDFDPASVKTGDIIFVSQSGTVNPLTIFFSQYHPNIKVPYILVTHNGYWGLSDIYRQHIDDEKIFLWFAQNAEIKHPKLIPIPIGLENAWHGKHYQEHMRSLEELAKTSDARKYLALLNFKVNTNDSERLPVYSRFCEQPFCYCSSPKDLASYLRDVCFSKFVFSPRGNGLDCHRTWEALYLGAYPIVKTSPMDQMYDDLPVLIINDWQEVTEEFLEKRYKEMQARSYQLEKLYMPYWLNIFEKAKIACKESVEQAHFFDVIIPVCQKDIRTLDYAIEGIRRHGIGVRRVIVVSDKPYTDKAEWFDEARYPFSKSDLAKKISEIVPKDNPYNGKRNGWIYQQLLKLYAPFVIPDIADNILVLDADTIFLKDVAFIDQDGFALYNVGTEHHKPYFEHAAKLIADQQIKKVFCEYSGICHHMLLQKSVLKDLFEAIRSTHHIEPWQALLACINPIYVALACMSEYEIYFNFIFSRNYKVKIRKLAWENCCFRQNIIIEYQKAGFDYISCHDYFV